MITLDTSGLIAYIETQSAYHEAVREALEADAGPVYIAVAALAEMTFMLEMEFPEAVQLAFIDDLSTGAYTPYWSENDLFRVRELVERYDHLTLGFTDAAIIACAERHRGRVLTLDRRNFDVVARGEETITVLP